MKRFAIWAIYLIGALSIVYIALYLYVTLTAPRLVPGKPIELYRDPSAPKYSALR